MTDEIRGGVRSPPGLLPGQVTGKGRHSGAMQ